MGVLQWLTTLGSKQGDLSVRALDLSDIGITATTSTSAGGLRRDEQGWRNSSVAFRALSQMISNLASVELGVKQEDGEWGDDSFLHTFNRVPNPSMSSRVVRELLWWGLETDGVSFSYLDRGESGAGPVRAIWPLTAFSVEPIVEHPGYGGELLGFKVQRQDTGQSGVLLASEVLWLRYPDPENPWEWTSPLRALRHTLDSDAYARHAQTAEFRHAHKPSGVLYLGDVPRDVHDQVTADLSARHEGADNAGRTVVMSGPVASKFDRFSSGPSELGYLDTRRYNRDDILLGLGMPVDYLAGGATYENRAASRNTLWTDTLLPKLDLVASEIDRQMFAETSRTAAFRVDKVPALGEDTDAIAARIRGLMYTDVPTINEGRASIGLPPIEGGDVTLTEWRGRINTVLYPPFSAAPERAAPAVQEQRAVLAVRESKPRNWSQSAAHAFLRDHEPRLRGAVQQLASDQEARVMEAVERMLGERKSRRGPQRAKGLLERDGVNLLLDPQLELTASQEAMQPSLVQTAGDAAVHSAELLAMGAAEGPVADAIAAASRRAVVLAGQTLATTQAALESKVIQQGIAQGLSVNEIRDAVTDVFSDLSSRRALMIARTETVGAFNESSHLTAVDSGLVRARQWSATFDNRTRASHASLHGYTTGGLQDPYPNGCRYPGDAEGPASETILCRCTERWVFADDDLNTPIPEPPQGTWDELEDDRATVLQEEWL